MRLDEQILKRLKELVKVPHLVFPATVNSINRENMSCTVTPQDGVKLVGVRLKAGIEDLNDGLVEIPVIDSSVLVVLIGNTEENAFVARCSEVEEVLFYGGQHGGLIKVNELINQLEKVTDFLSGIRQAFSTAVPAPNDGGIKLQTDIVSALQNLQLPDYQSIENPKVKH